MSRWSCWLLGALALTGRVYAQNPPPVVPDTSATPLLVNLATVNTKDTVRIVAGRYRIVIANALPKATYTYQVSIEPPARIPPIAVTSVNPQSYVSCGKLGESVAALRDARREASLPELIAAFEKEKKGADAKKQECAPLVSEGEDYVQLSSRHVQGVWSVPRAGATIRVRVVREPVEGHTAQEFEQIYTTGPRGEWRVSYGFGFPLNAQVAKGQSFGRERRYYTEASDGKFFVRRERGAPAADAVPSMFFHFAEANEGKIAWDWLRIGLGVDLKNPTLFLGPGVTFRSNVLITGGLAARRERVLNGRYAIGQEVTGVLSEEQLTRDDIRVRPFLSATIRFDRNPLSGLDGDEKKKEAPPAKKEGGSAAAPAGVR